MACPAEQKKESARTFHFEVIDLLELAFKDGATSFVLTRLSLATGHVDIEANYITGGELELRRMSSSRPI